jgi:hypothetical protein
MAQRPKAKPKRKSQKNTDKAQSERFIETARKLSIDENNEKFERALASAIKSKIRPT